MSTLASRIRSLRRTLNYTQEELGKKIGVSGQQIQKYETSKDNLNIEKLYKIANALGVSIYELLPDETNGENAESDAEKVLFSGLLRVRKEDLGYLVKINGYINKIKSKALKEKIVEIVGMMGKMSSPK